MKGSARLRRLCLAGIPAVCGGLLFLTRTPRGYPDYKDLSVFDPAREGGHLLPNLNMLVTGEFTDRPVRFVTNSKGFRSAREFPYKAPPRVERILFLGDSFVDGQRTDQERTIGYLLEKRLNERIGKKPVEVLISGHNNPANAWYYFQEHGIKYRPRRIILGLTLGNDLTLSSYKDSLVPRRASDGSMRLLLKPPIRHAWARAPYLVLPEEAYAAGDGFDVLRDFESELREFLARRFDAFARSVRPRTWPWPNTRRRVHAADFNTSLCLFYAPPMKEGLEMLSDFEQVLAGFRALADRAGSKLLLVVFPTRAQVSTEDWALLTRAYSLNPAAFDLEYPNRRILAFCRKEKIDCLDLLPAFKNAELAGEGPLYRGRGDMHFNDKGQALAASRISEHLSHAGR